MDEKILNLGVNEHFHIVKDKSRVSTWWKVTGRHSVPVEPLLPPPVGCSYPEPAISRSQDITLMVEARSIEEALERAREEIKFTDLSGVERVFAMVLPLD